jgi:hypothetical protein
LQQAWRAESRKRLEKQMKQLRQLLGGFRAEVENDKELQDSITWEDVAFIKKFAKDFDEIADHVLRKDKENRKRLKVLKGEKR